MHTSREVGAEHFAALQATILAVISSGTTDTRIARGEEDADTLHAKLGILSALTPLVVDGEIGFLTTVGERDHIRRLVDAALQLFLVPAGGRVGVRWVDGAVASFAEGGERA